MLFALNDVSEAILALQSYASKPDADKGMIYRRNRELFYLLMQQGEFFVIASYPEIPELYIKEKTFLPYIASIKGNGDKRYLRIFSHIESAEDFARQCGIPEKCCVKVSAVDTMKLARYWLTQGVYGYVLNDGNPWATISFVEYLEIVFRELLEREEDFSDECAALMDIAVGVRSGDTSWTVIDNDDEVQIKKGQGDILQYEVLRDIAQKEKGLLLEWQGAVIESSTKALEKVLSSLPDKTVCHSCNAEIEFYDYTCPYCGQMTGSQQNYDFDSIADIGLNFTTLTPAKRKPPEEQIPHKTRKPNLLYGYKKFANAINSFVNRITGVKVSSKTEEDELGESTPLSETSNSDEPCSEGRKTQSYTDESDAGSRRTQSNIDKPENEGCKTSPSNIRDHRRLKKEKGKRFSRKRIIQLGTLVTVAVMLGFLGKQAAVLHEFSGDLYKGSISEAKDIYDIKMHNSMIKNRADRKVVEYIDALMGDYASNEADASYTNMKLKECEVFDAESDYLKTCFEKASQLEVSKNSYVSGKSYFEQKNYLQGLSDWLYVIPQDANNYDAVKATVDKYGTEYKLHGLLQCADYKAEGDTTRYQKGLDVLLKWFPNDQDILNEKEKEQGGAGDFAEPTGSGSVADMNAADKGNRFSPYYVPSSSGSGSVVSVIKESAPIGDYPIKIDKLSVALPNGQGGRDLCIKWVNVSGKTIDKITFTTEAVNGMGKPAKCGRGGYSIYRASAIGPFDHGEGMDGSIVWESAWFNSTIEKANLIDVTIEYKDGKTEKIDKEEDLEAILA